MGPEQAGGAEGRRRWRWGWSADAAVVSALCLLSFIPPSLLGEDDSGGGEREGVLRVTADRMTESASFGFTHCKTHRHKHPEPE